MTNEADLHTETFSNARGWTAVRVTHRPSGTVAERVRTTTLKSAVEAQRECIVEVRQRLADGTSDQAAGPVTRAEFDALAVRVAQLEASLQRK